MPIELLPLTPGSISYLDVGEADDLASSQGGLAAWQAASEPGKAAALNQASSEVDAAMPYQGRPWDPRQPRQFPRVAYESRPGSAPFGAASEFGAGATPAGALAPSLLNLVPAVVWDWDPATNAPVIPPAVKLAVLHQADAILSGTRDLRVSAQHDGVASVVTGSLTERYRRVSPPGVTTGLCRRSWAIMRRYRLRGGRLL